MVTKEEDQLQIILDVLILDLGGCDLRSMMSYDGKMFVYTFNIGSAVEVRIVDLNILIVNSC